MTTVLLIDDVPALCEQYAYDLQRLAGYQPLIANDGRSGIDLAMREPVDCILLDLEMPGLDGFGVLGELRRLKIEIPVIVYTGTGDFDRCVRAVKMGAQGFIDKSEPMERVVQQVEQAISSHRLSREVERLRERLAEEGPLLGESPAMQSLRAMLARLASIPSPVLILGESGSGKELAARELHRLSPRSSRTFLAVNCAALPEALAESSLFGHEAGAFTGASRLHRGAFESASGGTLFLDEVGELPKGTQAKLLRVLEEGAVTRVGGTKPVPLDTRVVAATNLNLQEEIRQGRFREDLLYRLNVHTVRIPPLRERPGDIPLLVTHLLNETARRFGMKAKSISPEAAEILSACSWRRNNVRELRNIVERMVMACDGDRVEPEHVPEEIADLALYGDWEHTAGASSAHPSDTHPDASGASGFGPGSNGAGGRSGGDPETSETGKAGIVPGATLRNLKAQAERRILLDALERNHWQITQTARELGLADHSSLLKIMRRHGIRKPEG